MIWKKIKAEGKREDLDTMCAVMSMLESGLEIEDYSDITADPVYGELIDEEILKKDKTVASVSIYISEDKNENEYISFLKDRFAALGVQAKVFAERLNEEDWADSWKQYYKPVFAGEKIVIVPMWEKFDAKEGQIIVKMDPGMAFGTGTHETTRLCVRLMEKYLKAGDSVLDVGTGSGILSICAEKLGSGNIFACDIDPVAVRVAKENVKDNGCTKIECGVSDLLRDAKMPENGKYDLVIANIVADIIIRMLPDLPPFIKTGGTLILSGIINTSAEDVKKCAENCGFEIVCEIAENDWKGIALIKK